jgi:hypothetical protein
MKKKIVLIFVCMLMFLTSMTLIVNANTISSTINNTPPDPPVITGPTSGKIKEYYIYGVTVTDPDDNLLIKLEINFGDGITEICGGCTTRPWVSGETIEVEHRWTKSGSYDINARVQDEIGEWSEWSEPFSVSMPKVKTNIISLFQRLFSLLPNIYNIF